MSPFGEGSWVPSQHNVAWTKAHLHAKCHLDPSSRLATIDIGPKIGEGGLRPLLREEGWVPIEHKVPWAKAYLHTKWHLDASSRLTTTDMGQKFGGSAPFLGRGSGVPS